MRAFLISLVVHTFLWLNLGLIAGGRVLAWFVAGECTMFLATAIIGAAAMRAKKDPTPATTAKVAELKAVLEKLEKPHVS